MLNVSKLTALAMALALAAGCSSSGSGDSEGEMAGSDNPSMYDPNAGYGAGDSGSIDASAGMDGNGSANGGYGDGYGSGMSGNSGNAGSAGSGDEAALRAMTTFYFEYDSSELKPEAMRALDVHARDLRTAGSRVILEGHADERGTREYNMALGERRAKAVLRYLVMQGVSPSQLEVVSYGEERPVALGETEQAWAQNRRVELLK